MNSMKCCNQQCNQGRDCPLNKARAADPLAAITHERNAFVLAIAVVIGALLFFSYLEGMPS